MWITYKPEDQPPDAVQRWEFDPDRVRAAEAELIERRYGSNWDTWRNDVRAGSVRARRVLLWHLIRQRHPLLRYEDTPDFFVGELLVEHSVAELADLRDRITRAKLPDDEREQYITALDVEIAEAMTREGLDVEELGKATSPVGANGTGSTSPIIST